MRISRQQRELLEFLMESPAGSWTRGATRWRLYGVNNLTGSQRASFSRLLRSLERRSMIALTGGQSDRQRIMITATGARSVAARAGTIVSVCEVRP